MADLKVGDSFPSDVTFSYVPYTPETGDITSCGIPINYNASKGMSSLFLNAFPYPRFPIRNLLVVSRTPPSTLQIRLLIQNLC